MDRKAYTSCMTPHMKGTGKTKEQRQNDMCIGAKLCTGKASTHEEAERLCAEQAKIPKPFKAKGARGKCRIELSNLASCLSTTLSLEGLTPDNLAPRLAAALQTCGVRKPASNTSYRRFMNTCVREQGGDFKTAQRDIKVCQGKWNEQEAAA